MNRRLAFIIMFVLCFTLGISACIIVYRSDDKQMQTLAEKQPLATLSAPATVVSEPKETVSESVVEAPTVIPNTEEAPEAAEEMPEVTEEVPATDEPEPVTPKYRFTVESIASRLCVRKAPSLDAEILGFIYTDQSGEVIEIGEEWVQLKYEDLEGYAFKEYLIIEELPQS